MKRSLPLLLLLLSGPAEATEIRLVVSAVAGGSYDVWARLTARHLPKHLPDHPTVVVENRAGASGRIVANWFASGAPRDGSVIGALQQQLPLSQVLGEAGVEYDASKFTWLGSPAQLGSVLVTWKRARWDGNIAGTSTSSAQFILPKLANYFGGAKYKVVLGYSGNPDMALAMERGEVDGVGSYPWSEWKKDRPDWVRDGKIVPVVQMGMKPKRNVIAPILQDLVDDLASREAVELVSVVTDISRPIAAPPGIPEDVAQVLRQALADTYADPEFRAEATRIGLDINPIGGGEISTLVRRVLGAGPGVIDRLRAALTP